MSHEKEKTAVGLLPVLAAIIGNTIITIAKFIGFMLSGSATLFAEVIHSVADVSNQALLYRAYISRYSRLGAKTK